MIEIVRFIPACAGNAEWIDDHPAEISVHPRVCGERGLAVVLLDMDGGSSPRVRGTPAPALETAAPHRFIPACAGNAAAGR